MNGLPLRGDTEKTDFDEVSRGLFLHTLGYLLFKVDPGLEAKGLMKIITTTLEEYDIKLLLVTIFCGASVNSGWKNGI